MFYGYNFEARRRNCLNRMTYRGYITKYDISSVPLLKYANTMPSFSVRAAKWFHINEAKLARPANYASLLLRYAHVCVDVTHNEVGCIYVPGRKYIYHANEYV